MSTSTSSLKSHTKKNVLTEKLGFSKTVLAPSPVSPPDSYMTMKHTAASCSEGDLQLYYFTAVRQLEQSERLYLYLSIWALVSEQRERVMMGEPNGGDVCLLFVFSALLHFSLTSAFSLAERGVQEALG